MTVEDLIKKAAELGASDVHIAAGLAPKCRKDGRLTELFSTALSSEECEDIARDLAGDLYPSIKASGELDLAKTIAGERVRINIFRQQEKFLQHLEY